MSWEIREGDVLDRLREMPDESVHCVVTSPPYWGLRDYGVPGQLGLERHYGEYVVKMVEVFGEVRRVLRADGTLWLNLGDSYYSGNRGGYRNDSHRWDGSPMQSNTKGTHMEEVSANRLPQKGLKDKDLVGIPWRVAFALQADGWWLRSDIIWSKPNPMPESVTDRPTKAHEYVFLLTKSARYFYDTEAIAESADLSRVGQSQGRWGNAAKDDRAGAMGREPSGNEANGTEVVGGTTRNKRTVWTIATKPYAEAHFATFPPELPEICIKAGSPPDGVVLDPFSGAGTTGVVALRLGRSYIGIELNPEYAEMSRRRIDSDCPLFNRDSESPRIPAEVQPR